LGARRRVAVGTWIGRAGPGRLYGAADGRGCGGARCPADCDACGAAHPGVIPLNSEAAGRLDAGRKPPDSDHDIVCQAMNRRAWGGYGLVKNHGCETCKRQWSDISKLETCRLPPPEPSKWSSQSYPTPTPQLHITVTVSHHRILTTAGGKGGERFGGL
jgi:hypothetical protein